VIVGDNAFASVQSPSASAKRSRWVCVRRSNQGATLRGYGCARPGRPMPGPGMISPPVARRKSGLATQAPSRPRRASGIARVGLRSRGLSSVSTLLVPQPHSLCNEERHQARQKDPEQDSQDDHNSRHRKPLVDGRAPRLGRHPAWSQPAGGRRTECDRRAIATTVPGPAPTAPRALKRFPGRSDTVRCGFPSFYGNGSRNECDLSADPLKRV
jgi:hypothetical protein